MDLGNSMMRKCAFIGALFLASGLCHAADGASRDVKIHQLLEAQGMMTTFDEQMRMREESSRRSVQIMVDETLKRLKPNTSFRKKFNDAAQELFSALQPPWSAQEVTDIWASIYGSKFTDDELDQLLAFYTSPVAQKETIAGRASLAEFGQYLQSQYAPYEKKAIQQYVERMQVLGKECRCKR